MKIPMQPFQMTEAEIIRELAGLEPRVRDLYAQLERDELMSKDVFELNRSAIRAAFLRDELDSRICTACV